MNDFKTVIGFTFRNKFRTKAFMVTTLIIALLITIVAHIPYAISIFSSDEPTKIGMIQSQDEEITTMLAAFFEAQEDSDIELTLYESGADTAGQEKEMKQYVQDGEIEGYLMLEPSESGGFPKVYYKSEGNTDFSVMSPLETGLQIVKTQWIGTELGLTDQQQQQLYEPVQLEKRQISATSGSGAGGIKEEGKTFAETATSMGLVYVVVIVLFTGIMVSGQLIATEITAEKSSRVMEILITSVSPLKQMFGKIIGMFLIALAQIGFLGVTVALNLSLPYNQEILKNLEIDLSQIPASLWVYAVVFYLMGFFLYATLFAAIGSIVSRTEDLGQAVMPITFLSLAGFYLVIFGLNSPDSSYIVFTSFIPFFSPFVMFMRIGVVDPALWEVLLSIGILAVTIYLCGWLSAKIYRTGVLMYGKKPSWKEIRKAMKAYKF
ncbi:ABC transporter permease [Marinicrinis sediminis]|uniref:ABC transporter permease n=1 Tax=Marinicrinis sediminis TaxID=1652465 RepID=A0ABW5RG22_9BACL